MVYQRKKKFQGDPDLENIQELIEQGSDREAIALLFGRDPEAPGRPSKAENEFFQTFEEFQKFIQVKELGLRIETPSVIQEVVVKGEPKEKKSKFEKAQPFILTLLEKSGDGIITLLSSIAKTPFIIGPLGIPIPNPIMIALSEFLYLHKMIPDYIAAMLFSPSAILKIGSGLIPPYDPEKIKEGTEGTFNNKPGLFLFLKQKLVDVPVEQWFSDLGFSSFKGVPDAGVLIPMKNYIDHHYIWSLKLNPYSTVDLQKIISIETDRLKVFPEVFNISNGLYFFQWGFLKENRQEFTPYQRQDLDHIYNIMKKNMSIFTEALVQIKQGKDYWSEGTSGGLV